ncbi:hypothetical protein KC332_g8372 [Hortaea werneckii]|nr:hypothetical protein KC358_g8786 [Hortaea werneckii]KAI6834252.1 hypothetical protein KC350_g6755 [Hortaea werneckii]KAI6926470.1 hypothetical protein KC348_g8667 [Hortaea werneckii]KAI6933772.1 hypothetical protein KC341_g8061 [Hortaea werneckii]KAI6968315.1 hypothetical protein KC321_g8532 [Hortaea werneckii]
MDEPEEPTVPPYQLQHSARSVEETNADPSSSQPNPSPARADLPLLGHEHPNRLPSPDHHGDEGPVGTARGSPHRRANSDYSQFRSAAQKVVSQQAKLDQLSQDVDVLRDSANYAWECRKHQYRFVQSSMTKFVEAAKKMLIEVPLSPSLELLSQLLEQVQGDIKVVTDQIESSTAAEGELGNKQFRLRRREQKFAAAVQETLRTLSDQGVHTRRNSEITSPNDTPQVDAPSSVHPLLERYYASVADLEVLQERLADLQSEFEEEKIGRQLRQDQGQSPEDPDEEFEAAYAKQIQEVRSALTEAENGLAHLEEECVHEGLLVDHAADHFLPQPMSADAHANEETETPEEGSLSSLALGMPVMTPGTLPWLQLKDMVGHSDRRQSQSPESLFRGIPVDHSLHHGALAKSRVVEWLEQGSEMTPVKDTELTPTENDGHHRGPVLAGSPALSWPLATARAKEDTEKQTFSSSNATTLVSHQRSASAPLLPSSELTLRPRAKSVKDP